MASFKAPVGCSADAYRVVPATPALCPRPSCTPPARVQPLPVSAHPHHMRTRTHARTHVFKVCKARCRRFRFKTAVKPETSTLTIHGASRPPAQLPLSGGFPPPFSRRRRARNPQPPPPPPPPSPRQPLSGDFPPGRRTLATLLAPFRRCSRRSRSRRSSRRSSRHSRRRSRRRRRRSRRRRPKGLRRGRGTVLQWSPLRRRRGSARCVHKQWSFTWRSIWRSSSLA